MTDSKPESCGHSTSGSEQCINCGDEIEGEPVYNQGAPQEDGIGRLADGETVGVSELFAFDDGPYCSLGCSLDTGTEQGGASE